jgi:membrane protein DedA with SNARE-associated domain
MLDKLFDPLVTLFLTLGEKYGYIAIFIGAIADSLIPIVPSEIVYASAGFWAYKGYINLPIAVLIAVIGNLLVSALFWYLGKEYGHGFLLKCGKYLGFSPKDLEKSEKVFAKWGYFAVLVCQFIPLLRSLISIPSGVLELDFKKFMFATAIGAAIWNAVLMIATYNLGENWGQIITTVAAFSKPVTIILGLTIIVAIGYIVYRLYTNRKINAK